MPPPDDLIASLREALGLAPGNLSLRVHLGELLLQYGDAAQAEKEFREALSRDAGWEAAKLGLAEAFCRQGKTSAALALLESWPAGETPARAHLWAAKAHFQDGDTEAAESRYRQAVNLDPSLLDPEWETRLAAGIGGTTAGAGDTGIDPEADGATADEEGALIERPALDFSAVGGMDKLKEEIRAKIIHPLEHPEIYRAYGKKIGGGILLYGPPGCGKTYLARATAGQVKAGFMSVGIHEVLNMYLGQSERNLHDIFETARANAPCVLFFDEVDAIAANRADMKQSAGRQLINQFLSELDGIGGSSSGGSANEGVLVLAATNAPWHLDSAFRRPGRFDRILFVPPPDAEAREQIFRLMLKGKPVEDPDYAKLAKASQGFSGADIKAAVESAVEAKLSEAIKAGKPSPLTTKDLAAAAKATRPSAQEWFSTARNYALYSNQGGLYDDILAYLKL